MIPELVLGNWHIPTYLFVLSLVYCLCAIYFFKRLEKYGLSPSQGADLSLLVMLGGFIGARIFYILYQEPQYYFDHPIEILQFWLGGFVFFGGFMGAALCVYVYARFYKIPLGIWLNVMTPVLALGYGLGRLACFLNGCCYGKVSEVPWAVKFIYVHGHRHPTQLYAVIYELILWGLLLLWQSRVDFKSGATLFYIWLIGHGLGRLGMEFFRDDPRGPEIMGLSVSSLMSVILVVFGALALYWPRQGNKMS